MITFISRLEAFHCLIRCRSRISSFLVGHGSLGTLVLTATSSWLSSPSVLLSSLLLWWGRYAVFVLMLLFHRGRVLEVDFLVMTLLIPWFPIIRGGLRTVLLLWACLKVVLESDASASVLDLSLLIIHLDGLKRA
jgi:hypothetical protein